MSTDVLIVGGGPAGAAAAIAAAQRGLDVTLVEGATYPRDAPGETLHPGIAPLLATLGVDLVGWPRSDGIYCATGSSTRFEPYGCDARGAWRGYHVWRATFDAQLLDRARTLGCTVMQPVRALAVLDRTGRILTTHGVLQGRVLIDASGRREWLTRRARLRTRFASRRLIATYGYAAGAGGGPDPLWAVDREGWTWTARVTSEVTAWVRLRWSGRSEDRAWRPRALVGLPDARPVRGADVTWRRREVPAGEGYFCVGDAAAVIDPSSSQGVLRAIVGGTMAGYLAARSLRGDCTAQSAAHEYNGWLAALHEREVRRLAELARDIGVRPA